MGRRVAIAAGVVAVLLLMLLVFALLSLRSTRPQREGEVHVAGIAARVEVWRDSMGVAHVWAESESDLLFAQGFVHAQERLWQMELARRVVRGRLAEALGGALVPSDRFLRTIGLWRAAQDQERALDDASRTLLEAYAAGVNAAVAARDGLLPPEFLALGIAFEPWTVLHSLAMEKLMAWDLALYGHAASLTNATARLGPAKAVHLSPGEPAWWPTIIEEGVPEPPGEAAALLDAFSITRASNAWVVGGTRTASGKPVLANDMHLSLQAPSLWYLMALHGPDIDVTGMTLPGTPFVIAGHSRAVAWGFTNASLDDLDFFLIRRDSVDPLGYHVRDGIARMRVVAETVYVRGASQPDVFDVHLTRHGPVLSSVQDPAGTDLVAMRWAAHDPSRTFSAIAAFNRARSADDVVDAVRSFDNPHQNVVYADTAGTFGYVMGGRIPVRGAGRPPPALPVPGWSGDWDWSGYLPAERHPAVRNPARGFIVTANNRQTAGDIADRISNHWEMPWRAARIRSLLAPATALTADDAHRMQLDVFDMLAERYRPLAVNAARDAALDDAARTLVEWDLEARADAHGAALFYAWYERLRADARESLYGTDDGWLPRNAFNALLDRQELPWTDDPATAFRTAAQRAVVFADSFAAARRWGDVHDVAAAHALAASRLLDRLFGLTLGPAPADGSPTTVNVSHYDPGAQGDALAPPWTGTAGASQRHVVDLGDIDGAGGFILAGGQSGLPFERHYRDMWPLWQRGGLWRVPLDRAAAQARTVQRLVLIPAPS
jgi:penicillin amidase